MDRSRIVKSLNQPLVIWFLSSVVVGLISWQYTEIQKSSAEQKRYEQIVKKIDLEFTLLTRDIVFTLEHRERLNLPVIYQLISRLQYNASSEGTLAYFPSLMNLMLEIDSRKGYDGLEENLDSLYEALSGVSQVADDLRSSIHPNQQPYIRVWGG